MGNYWGERQAAGGFCHQGQQGRGEAGEAVSKRNCSPLANPLAPFQLASQLKRNLAIPKRNAPPPFLCQDGPSRQLNHKLVIVEGISKFWCLGF